MPKLDCPLKLSPVYKSKIWGRADLAPIFETARARGRSARPRSRGPNLVPIAEKSELIGEVWLTADESRILSGPPAGLTLLEACREYGSELLGESVEANSQNGPRFPILAKFLFTSDWLSVQVHPDDDYAREHEPGSPGKYEMWYIVKAERKARYLLGAKPTATKGALRTACESGASRSMLREYRPQEDEAIFLTPGTVHALGPGLVLFEAEQNSDLTYRLDDFGRVGMDGKPRPLHLEKGLEVARLDLPPRRALPTVTVRERFGTRRFVVGCSYFAVEDLLLRTPALFSGSPHRVEGLTVLEGEGRLETSAGWLGYRSGDTWLIPPGAGEYRLVPDDRNRLVKFYVPDLDADFRQPLRKKRVRAKRISAICFD